MASDPSKRRPAPGDPPAVDDHGLMETFSYDVSAGGSKGTGEAANRSPQKESARPAPADKLPSPDKPAVPPAAESKVATLARSPAARIDRMEVALDTKPENSEAPPTSGRRRIPSWLASVAVHCVLLLLLSLYALPALRKNEDFGLSASAASVEEVDEFQEIEIDPSENLDSLDAELASELADPGAASFGDLSAESALADVAGDTALFSDSLGDMGTLFGESGSGLSDLGAGEGTGNTASFFGSKVEGKRILYMFDNSGSMRNGRIETMIAELLKSVDSLKPRQEFYVIFYSDTVYGLGHPQPVDGFLRANKKNKQRLQQWLETVELCGGNAVDKAMQAAMEIRPDVVFMLSDGGVRTTKTGYKYKFLLNTTGRSFVVHTLGMGCDSEEGRNHLQAIAKAHGGTFREVQVQPAMIELSKRRPRPYRNSKNGGGSVWGTSFGN